MIFLFETILVKPIYNFFIFLIDFFPGHSAGLALVIVVVVVRICLLPLAQKNIENQIKLRSVQGQMKEIQEKFKGNKEKQTIEMMLLYKNNKINPFSVFFILLIQIPIISALYFIFKSGLPSIKTEWLYSFVPNPSSIEMHYFGIDLVGQNIWLAILVFFVYFVSSQIMVRKNHTEIKNDGSFSSELQKNMLIQAKYVFPIITGVFGYSLGSFICLYLLIGGIFTIFQEILIRRPMLNVANSKN